MHFILYQLRGAGTAADRDRAKYGRVDAKRRKACQIKKASTSLLHIQTGFDGGTRSPPDAGAERGWAGLLPSRALSVSH